MVRHAAYQTPERFAAREPPATRRTPFNVIGSRRRVGGVELVIDVRVEDPFELGQDPGDGAAAHARATDAT